MANSRAGPRNFFFFSFSWPRAPLLKDCPLSQFHKVITGYRTTFRTTEQNNRFSGFPPCGVIRSICVFQQPFGIKSGSKPSAPHIRHRVLGCCVRLSTLSHPLPHTSANMKVMQLVAAALMAAPRWVLVMDAGGSVASKREKRRVRCVFALLPEFLCSLSFLKESCLPRRRVHSCLSCHGASCEQACLRS